VQNYANIIGRRVGREISVLHPLLDARMATGDRANAVLFPISNAGNSLTIRKFTREPWTVVDFIKNKTCTSEVFALIWLAMQYEMNVIFSGGTASGKTSMLNVCMPFIPPNQRIISIEDTRELQLPSYLFWEPLVTRLANPEGKGEVSMLDLLLNSLRMRPDRIVLGEVRHGDDALVLFEAMHTGHSVYATMHANNMHETIQRLVNPPISVPPRLLDAVNLNVVMFRDRRLRIRRVYQVGEFVRGKEEGETAVKPNIMYRWVTGEDKLVEYAKSMVLFEELSKHTSFNTKEIETELAVRKRILDWLVEHDVRGIRNISAIMETYYTTPEKVITAAQKNLEPSTLS
jgi:flagellar protein FlaI